MPYCTNPVRLFTHRVLKRFQINLLDPMPYKTHIKAPDLIEQIGYDRFKSYFSFAVVRNPWDWNVSLYKYMKKNDKHPEHEDVIKFKNFDEYIRDRCEESQSLPFQKDFIFSDDSEQLVDYIARFESIGDDFQKICSEIGVAASLPHLNISNTGHYRDFYTPETRELIYKHYQKDIDFFGYEF